MIAAKSHKIYRKNSLKTLRLFRFIKVWASNFGINYLTHPRQLCPPVKLLRICKQNLEPTKFLPTPIRFYLENKLLPSTENTSTGSFQTQPAHQLMKRKSEK